jgi:hypothetical protein
MLEDARMEEILVGSIAVATIVFGVIAVVFSEWAVLHSREDNDQSPPTALEIWFIRLVGVGALLGGGYGLYAILTGMPGADGPPLP